MREVLGDNEQELPWDWDILGREAQIPEISAYPV